MHLSIIIPTFNDLSLPLAQALAAQAELVDGLSWELLVGDDCSTDRAVVAQNRGINQLPHCRYIERPRNSGRAAIRNFLAQEAQGEWLLCIDGDARIDCADYLPKMLAAGHSYEVCYGGYRMMPGPEGNLRWRYERAAAPDHTAEKRRQQPYAAFNISNLLIRRTLLLAHPLDERITRYGYEDVALGKALEHDGIVVGHIDAPVAYYDYESNDSFLSKTEEGLTTLWEHRDTLAGYSRLLTAIDGMPAVARWMVWAAFRIAKGWMRSNLLSERPSVRVFTCYKVGWLLDRMRR